MSLGAHWQLIILQDQHNHINVNKKKEKQETSLEKKHSTIIYQDSHE
jgi:hypothetical protein